MASSKSHKQSRLAQMLADQSDKHHGTTTGYGYGCRCARCVKAKSDYTAHVRESMTDEDRERKRQQRRSGILKHREELLRNPDDPRHGSKTGYDYGCRCDRCKAAKSDADKRPPTLFAAYYGDRFIDVGTSEELAERLGIPEPSVRNRAAPSARDRAERRGGLLITRLEDDDG